MPPGGKRFGRAHNFPQSRIKLREKWGWKRIRRLRLRGPTRIDPRRRKRRNEGLLHVWITVEGANGESPYSFCRNCTAISWRPLLRGRERTTSQLCFTELFPAPGTSMRHICPTASASRRRNDTPLNDRSRVWLSSVAVSVPVAGARTVIVALLWSGLRESRRRSGAGARETGGRT